MEAYVDSWHKKWHFIYCRFLVQTSLFLIKMNYFGLQGVVWTWEMLMPVFSGTVCVVQPYLGGV